MCARAVCMCLCAHISVCNIYTISTEDSTELAMVKNSLLILIKRHPKEALAGVFGQVTGDDDMTREKCIEFVCNSVMKIKNELFATNFDTEEFFIEQIKQVILCDTS